MKKLSFSRLHDVLDDYDLFLFDLWGVVIEGKELYHGVIDAINDILSKKKVIFLTNAPRPHWVVANNLNLWGMNNVKPEMVITSGDVARDVVRMHDRFAHGIKVFHLGTDRNDDILREIDHELVTDISNADILMISTYRDEHEDIHEYNDLLKEAANQKNLLTICCNPDVIIPLQGVKRYCAGYFAGIVEHHGGQVLYTGKPNLPVYERVFEKYPNIHKERILMIGDTFDTDILGANRAGIPSALVITGNSLQIHGQYETMAEKLEAIEHYSQQMKIYPSFFTKIAL